MRTIDSPPAIPDLKVYVGEEVFDIPEPDWLLRDFIQEAGLTILHGEPGSGKSLLAQAWASCLANGWSWMGREPSNSEAKRVLYIMAEGQSGLPSRLHAWMQDRNTTAAPLVQWHLSPLPLWRAPHMEHPTLQQESLLAHISDNDIHVLFVDTLAATFGGGNENAQQDMNMYVDLVMKIKAMGCAVVIIHHDNKTAKDIRGSTVLKGSADTVIQTVPDWSDDGRLLTTTVRCRKQKDGSPFGKIVLVPTEYEVPTKFGTSVALRYETAPDVPEQAIPLTEIMDDLLACITSDPGGSWRHYRDELAGRNTRKQEARDGLEESGEIYQDEDGLWFPVARNEELPPL